MIVKYKIIYVLFSWGIFYTVSNANMPNSEQMNCVPGSSYCESTGNKSMCEQKPCCEWKKSSDFFWSGKCIHKCSLQADQSSCLAIKTMGTNINICNWSNNVCAESSNEQYRAELKARAQATVEAKKIEEEERKNRMKILYKDAIDLGYLSEEKLGNVNLENADCKARDNIKDCNKEKYCVFVNNTCIPNVCGEFDEFYKRDNKDCALKADCKVYEISAVDGFVRGEMLWFKQNNNKCVPNFKNKSANNFIDD